MYVWKGVVIFPFSFPFSQTSYFYQRHSYGEEQRKWVWKVQMIRCFLLSVSQGKEGIYNFQVYRDQNCYQELAVLFCLRIFKLGFPGHSLRVGKGFFISCFPFQFIFFPHSPSPIVKIWGFLTVDILVHSRDWMECWEGSDFFEHFCYMRMTDEPFMISMIEDGN